MWAVMAVRNFETAPATPYLRLVPPTARSRHEVRRTRQRHAALALIAVTTPFAFALVLLGVGR